MTLRVPPCGVMPVRPHSPHLVALLAARNRGRNAARRPPGRHPLLRHLLHGRGHALLWHPLVGGHLTWRRGHGITAPATTLRRGGRRREVGVTQWRRRHSLRRRCPELRPAHGRRGGDGRSRHRPIGAHLLPARHLRMSALLHLPLHLALHLRRDGGFAALPR
jgi:hypothetical protein